MVRIGDDYRLRMRLRIPMTIGVVSFIAGVGLWVQSCLVIYHASRLTGPVEGDWSGLFWRIFFSGIFLIAGTYLLTKHGRLLKNDLRNDPIVRMLKRKGV